MLQWVPVLFKWLNIYGRLRECEEDRQKLWSKANAAEARQVDLESELEAYRDLTLIGTLTVDCFGRITDASVEIVAMTGYTLEALLRMALRELLPYQLRPDHDKWVKELAKGDRQVRKTLIEAELRHADGSAVPVIVKLMEFHSGSGVKYRADLRRR